jgi:hypothetical protein
MLIEKLESVKMGRVDNPSFSVSISLDLETFIKLEEARDDMNRSEYVKDAILTKLNAASAI